MMRFLGCHPLNRSVYQFSMAFRPLTGPLSVTKTASSVKSAAMAAASLLFYPLSYALPIARIFSLVCGSGAFVSWAKVGKAKLIASSTRTPGKPIFIVSSRDRVEPVLRALGFFRCGTQAAQSPPVGQCRHAHSESYRSQTE